MLEEKIKSFIARIETMRDSVLTEEATKTFFIMPFFALLGYDVLTLWNLSPNLQLM